MPGWWSYAPADFALFSARTYGRLVEQYNRELWPLQPAMVLAGFGLLWLLRRRATWGWSALALAWLWVAWGFHLERYARIQWAATWFAAAFALQAVALAALSRRVPAPSPAGITVFAIVLVGYPLLALVQGRPWPQAEVFGLMPDPTALATAALLLASRGLARWALLVVPLAWCVVAAVTWWGLR